MRANVFKERPEWCYGKSGNVLHRVKRRSEICSRSGWWKDSFLCGPRPKLETVCGRSMVLYAPGFFSRLGCPRCKQCCRLIRITAGEGCPLNDKTCRRVKR